MLCTLHPNYSLAKNSGFQEFGTHLFTSINDFREEVGMAYSHVRLISNKGYCNMCDGEEDVYNKGRIIFHLTDMQRISLRYCERQYKYLMLFNDIISEMKQGYSNYDAIKGITRYVIFFTVKGFYIII